MIPVCRGKGKIRGTVKKGKIRGTVKKKKKKNSVVSRGSGRGREGCTDGAQGILWAGNCSA